jgi:hypothetical protein
MINNEWALVQRLESARPSFFNAVSLADKLTPLVGRLREPLRPNVASYLRNGNTVFAIMEYTRDVLEDRFGVSGGSAVLTDRVYFWRADAAEYVGEYGIDVSDEVLVHMRDAHWQVSKLDPARVLEIDQYLWSKVHPD